MAKPKTRLVIAVDGVDREILSLREHADGGILVAMKKSLNGELPRPTGTLSIPLVEERLTIHPSPKSDGYLFTSTVRTSDGSLQRGAAMIYPDEDRLTWPLYGRRCADLTARHYVSMPRKRDAVVSLGSYNPQSANLVYFVVVTHSGEHLPEDLEMIFIVENRDVFSVLTLPFMKFNLHVLYCYMAAPSYPQSDIALFQTSPRRLNGVPEQSRPAEPRLSVTAEQLRIFLFYSLLRFGENFVNKVSEWQNVVGTPLSPMLRKELERRAFFYFPDPL